MPPKDPAQAVRASRARKLHAGACLRMLVREGPSVGSRPVVVSRVMGRYVLVVAWRL